MAVSKNPLKKVAPKKVNSHDSRVHSTSRVRDGNGRFTKRNSSRATSKSEKRT